MRITKAFLFLLLVGLAVGFIIQKRPFISRLKDGRVVPPWGLQVNQNGIDSAKVSATEDQLKRIYRAVVAYRTLKGSLPTAGSELWNIALTDGSKLSDTDKLPSGYVESDRYAQGPSHIGFTFDFLAARPDGRSKPAYPSGKERDAWVSTDAFIRSNAVIYPDWTARRNPTGFYVVLWSDGEVERIPQPEIRLALRGGAYEEHFPGQAGLPPNAPRMARFQGMMSNAVPALAGNPNAPN